MIYIEMKEMEEIKKQENLLLYTVQRVKAKFDGILLFQLFSSFELHCIELNSKGLQGKK